MIEIIICILQLLFSIGAIMAVLRWLKGKEHKQAIKGKKNDNVPKI